MAYWPTPPVPVWAEKEELHIDCEVLFCALNQVEVAPGGTTTDCFDDLDYTSGDGRDSESYPTVLLTKHHPYYEDQRPWGLFGYISDFQTYKEMYDWAMDVLRENNCCYEVFIPPEPQLDLWRNDFHDTAFCITRPYSNPVVRWLP